MEDRLAMESAPEPLPQKVSGMTPVGIEAYLADCRNLAVFDAQLAALCRESGVSALPTEDRDFDRFPHPLSSVRSLSDSGCG